MNYLTYNPSTSPLQPCIVSSTCCRYFCCPKLSARQQCSIKWFWSLNWLSPTSWNAKPALFAPQFLSLSSSWSLTIVAVIPSFSAFLMSRERIQLKDDFSCLSSVNCAWFSFGEEHWCLLPGFFDCWQITRVVSRPCKRLQIKWHTYALVMFSYATNIDVHLVNKLHCA